MAFSILPHLGASPVRVSASWSELRAVLLAPPTEAEDKSSVPLWSPAVWPDGTPSPELETVQQIETAVLDVDGTKSGGVPLTLALETSDRLRAFGLEAVLHSSYSATPLHPRGLTKFRIVVPLLTPVSREDWRPVWRRIAYALCPSADPQCKNANRSYFVPSCPRGETSKTYALHLQGRALDPYSLADVPTPAADLPSPTRPTTRDDLAEVAQRWRRGKASARRKALGNALLAVTKSEPFAAPGERDQIAFELISDLVRALPDADLRILVQHFVPSLGRMGPDAPTEDVLLDKAQRARKRLEDGGDLPPPRHSRAHDPRILVTSLASNYYLRSDEGWIGPFAGDAVDPAIHAHLAPAAMRGELALVRVTEDGEIQRRPRPELLEQYGSEITDHAILLGAPASYYQHAGVFREARARPRVTEAEFSSLADTFLRTLAGPQYARLETWLSVFPDLKEPIAALFLHGVKSAGKGLLVESLSRLWTEHGSTPLESVIGNFNEGILHCPLLFADEHLPQHGAITGRLREIIQARTHSINVKHQPVKLAHGAIRLAIAANNETILAFNEDLSPDDLAAINERFLVVAVQRTSPKFFVDNPDAARTLRDEDTLVKHVLWLAQNRRPAQKPGRFWTQPDPGALNALRVSGRLRSAVCQWIVEWLRAPQILRGQGGSLSRPGPGGILVSLKEIFDGWTLYQRGVLRPHLAELQQALEAISEPETRQLRRVDRGVLSVWIARNSWDFDLSRVPA